MEQVTAPTVAAAVAVAQKAIKTQVYFMAVGMKTGQW